MLSIERQERILQELNKKRIVRVSELSKQLDVTEKTIRMDFENLEQKGLLKRVHGGAMLLDGDEDILPIRERQSRHEEEKAAIAQKALQLIRPGDTILLDGGSTTFALAEALGEFPVTVITNDIKIAYVLLQKENVHMMVLGGARIDDSSSLLGSQAYETMERMRVNRLFLGTTGVDAEHGLTVFNSMHADWKRRIIRCAQKVTLLADSTKFGKVALMQFAAVEQIDEVVSDGGLHARFVEELRERQVRCLLA